MRGPGPITAAEMQILLREAYSKDPEKSLLGQLARGLRDPAMPKDAKNRARAHPLWLTLGVIAVFVISVFVFFSFFRI